MEAYVEGAITEVGGGGGVMLKCSPATEAAYYKGSGSSVWSQLGAIGASATAPPHSPPVLVVVGQDSEHMASLGIGLDGDDHTATTVGQELVSRMGPQASLVLLPGASHFVTMEQPHQIAQIIQRNFLSISAGGGGSFSSRSQL